MVRKTSQETTGNDQNLQPTPLFAPRRKPANAGSIRGGEVAPKGVPVLHNPKSGNAGKQFNKVRNKLYKLVEVDEKEYSRLEKALARQNR